MVTFFFSENVPALGGNIAIPCLLLKFATARMTIPVLGLSPKIRIEYLPFSAILADANSCFHVNFHAFSDAMKTSLRHGCCSFGEM